MKKLSKALVVFGLLSGAGIAGAADEPAKLYGNITEGHYGISSSLSLNSTSVESQESVTSFVLSTRNHYYLVDRFGLGLVLNLQTQKDFTSLRVGPSAIWYFWMRERLGAYFSQDVTIRSLSIGGNSDTAFETDSEVGLNYFITPSVAVGPALDFFHRFGTSRSSRINQVSFLGQFSIYL